jgi:hypothetical protein
MAAKTEAKVITPVAILSYPHLDKPVQGTDDEGKPQGKPKYSCALVFPAGTNLDALKKAALAVAEVKWPGKVGQMIAEHKASLAAGGPFKFRLPFRTDAKEGYPEGCTFINVRSEQAPQCVYLNAVAGDTSEKPKPEKIPQDKITEVLYAGAKVIASIVAFAYDVKGNKGVSFALNNIQKRGEGERLDNRVAAEDEFTPDLSAAPADIDALLGEVG